MKLTLGYCYGFVLASGKYVEFRLVGGNAKGQVDVESPFGSDNITDFHALLGGGYTAYWEIKCPSAADAEPGAADDGG